jgi:hypothetical protein
MTEKITKEEGNTLIARYMGGVYEELLLFMQPNAGYIWKYLEGQEPDNEWSPWKRTTEALKYHISYDWLMPVVKKVQREMWEAELPHPQSMIANTLRNAVAELDINLIWIWTIEAIKLLNKIKDGDK